MNPVAKSTEAQAKKVVALIGNELKGNTGVAILKQNIGGQNTIDSQERVASDLTFDLSERDTMHPITKQNGEPQTTLTLEEAAETGIKHEQSKPASQPAAARKMITKKKSTLAIEKQKATPRKETKLIKTPSPKAVV